MLKNKIRQLLRNAGVDLRRYNMRSDPIALARQLMRAQRIDTVLDVGANAGQFCERYVLPLGAQIGIIHSFEPLPSAVSRLRRKAELHAGWLVHEYALGNKDGDVVLNVAQTDTSSSILPTSRLGVSLAPAMNTVDHASVQIRRLDSVWPSLALGSRILLKLDVQGAERAVLEGAGIHLSAVAMLRVELSTVALYEGQDTVEVMLTFLYSAGFRLIGVDSLWGDPDTGSTLQFDGVFLRNDAPMSEIAQA